MNDEPAAAEASDDTFGAEAEDRIRRGHLRPDFRVFLGVVPPVAFLAGNYLWSTQIAIIVAFVASAIVFVSNPGSGVIRALAVISFVVVAASTVAGLVSGSGKVFVAQNLIGDFLIAAIFLGSVVVHRPMVGAIALEMVPSMKPVMPIDHAVFVRLTLISVAVNIVSGVARAYLLDALSENAYVIASRAFGFPLGVAYFIYAYREITRTAIAIWPAGAPPPPEWRPARR